MASYYYLISSLPTLDSDGDMPMTYEEFLTCCQGNVSEETYQRLATLTLSSSEGPLLKESKEELMKKVKRMNKYFSVLMM